MKNALLGKKWGQVEFKVKPTVVMDDQLIQ
jgi:hypothetical protein